MTRTAVATASATITSTNKGTLTLSTRKINASNGLQTNTTTDDSTPSTKGRIGISLKPHELHRPDIAWPTVILFLIALFSVTLSIFKIYYISKWAAVFISYLSIFIFFTTLHDSVHAAVSRKYSWINGLIGRISVAFYLAPFCAFRYVHLEHHKHTNDPEKDPDFWSGSGPVWQTPLRWASQEWHYYGPFLTQLFKGTFTAAEATEALITLFTLYGGLIYWAISIDSAHCFFSFFLPLRMAVVTLAYTFDYVPHRPHKVTRAQDTYGCTSRVVGFYDTSKDNPLLTPLLLYQNYHNIHHLFPSIPFYRYSGIWWNHQQELLDLGTPIAPLYDPSRPWI